MPPASPATITSTPTRASTPTERLLTGSLVVGPLLYLAADTTYAVRGWDDAGAGVLHVLGAIVYGLVVLRVASWTAPTSWLRALLVLTAVLGMAGNVAYGFDTIHTSYGDVALVDRSGAATLIKPLGLCFPLSLAVVAFTLRRLERHWQATLVLLAAAAWPVAHIGNIAALAVATNVVLTVALGSLALSGTRTTSG
ncbi:hypothetical protein GCM10009795_001420 [Nocardioides hankookensis]|uniref:Uncharacterized protein n=1 Tax=Nocardioides hankookensis TaxID=443157 RepID=A0ABW1LMU7_9ACTN